MFKAFPHVYSVMVKSPEGSFSKCGHDHFLCYHPEKNLTPQEFQAVVNTIREGLEVDHVTDLLDALEGQGFKFIDPYEYDHETKEVITIGNNL